MHQREQRMRRAIPRGSGSTPSARPSITIGVSSGTAAAVAAPLRLRPRPAAESPSPSSTTSTCQPSSLQLGDHPAVVGVAAGRGGEIARHRERDALHHNGASYQARATCDSEMRDADRSEFAAVAAELAFARRCGQPVEDVLGQELGRGVDALEFRNARRDSGSSAARAPPSACRCARPMSTTMPLASSVLGDERCIDDEGRTVQRLGRPEHRAAKRMSDHDVIADFDDEQDNLSVG